MNIVSRLEEVLRRHGGYVRRYGFVEGSGTFARAVCGQGLVSLGLPSCTRGIVVRRHTTDVAAFEQVFIGEEYDISIGNMDPRFIIDAGANIGCASVFFAHRFPHASIWAFEPEASNFELLEQNSRGFSNIIPVKAAVWSSDTELEIQNPDDEKWAFRVQQTTNQGSSKVRALSIPSILKNAGAEWVDILKIDIEGAEKELLEANSAGWINRIGMIIIELHDWIKPGCSDALFAATKMCDWERFQIGENTVLIKK